MSEFEERQSKLNVQLLQDAVKMDEAIVELLLEVEALKAANQVLDAKSNALGATVSAIFKAVNESRAERGLSPLPSEYTGSSEIE